MATIYIVWCEDPVLKKSKIIGYGKSKSQAEQIAIKGWGQSTSIEQRTIRPEDIQTIREVNLNVAKYTLDNIKQISETVLKEKSQILLLRAELLNKIKDAEERHKMPLSFVFTDEIDIYLKSLEAGILV
jgi:hypothetical protein